MMENEHNTARWLMVFSAVALVLGPVVVLMGALSANSLFMGGALLAMGGLGLYAGMRASDDKRSD
jgi:hypothetical protein